jgi:hypothetical protein
MTDSSVYGEQLKPIKKSSNMNAFTQMCIDHTLQAIEALIPRLPAKSSTEITLEDLSDSEVKAVSQHFNVEMAMPQYAGRGFYSCLIIHPEYKNVKIRVRSKRHKVIS